MDADMPLLMDPDAPEPTTVVADNSDMPEAISHGDCDVPELLPERDLNAAGHMEDDAALRALYSHYGKRVWSGEVVEQPWGEEGTSNDISDVPNLLDL